MPHSQSSWTVRASTWPRRPRGRHGDGVRGDVLRRREGEGVGQARAGGLRRPDVRNRLRRAGVEARWNTKYGRSLDWPLPSGKTITADEAKTARPAVARPQPDHREVRAEGRRAARVLLGPAAGEREALGAGSRQCLHEPGVVSWGARRTGSPSPTVRTPVDGADGGAGHAWTVRRPGAVHPRLRVRDARGRVRLPGPRVGIPDRVRRRRADLRGPRGRGDRALVRLRAAAAAPRARRSRSSRPATHAARSRRTSSRR